MFINCQMELGGVMFLVMISTFCSYRYSTKDFFSYYNHAVLFFCIKVYLFTVATYVTLFFSYKVYLFIACCSLFLYQGTYLLPISFYSTTYVALFFYIKVHISFYSTYVANFFYIKLYISFLPEPGPAIRLFPLECAPCQAIALGSPQGLTQTSIQMALCASVF